MANVEGKIGTTSSVRATATVVRKRRGGLLRDRRLYWFAGALVVLALSTYVACVQPLRPDPYHDASLFSAEWFLYPIERNAPERLSRASTPINDVGPVPGTDRVWLVGDGCLVMRSEDRGRTWRMDSTILRMMRATTDYPSTQVLPSDSAGRSTNRSALPQTAMMISPWGVARRRTGPAMSEYSPGAENGPLHQNNPAQYPPEVGKREALNPLMNDPGSDPKKNPGRNDTTGPVRQPVRTNTVSDPASARKSGRNRGPAKPTPAPADTNHDRTGQTIVPSSGRSIPDLMSVMFVDERVGWICGSGGVVLKTTDGGTSWVRITVDSRQRTSVPTDTAVGAIRSKGPVTSGQPRLAAMMDPPAPELEAIDERTVFVSLGLPNGSDLEWAWRYTTDGGTTWNVVDPVPSTIGRIGELTVAHNGDILQMSASGSSWVVLDSVSSPLSAVHGIGDRIACVVGINGTLLRTTDGGRSWVNVALPRRQELTDIRFDTRGNGWIVGRGGTLFTTADSGATWLEGGLPLGTDARRVKVSDDGDVWVVGHDNIVLRSTDRGRSWGLCVAYDERASSVRFVDSRHGFIGAAHYVAETRNGGEIWRKIPLPAGITSRSVQFVDGSTGWMIDRGHNLYRTTDAGMSWSIVHVKNDTLSAAVYFIDAGQGWHLGRGGISFTSDGGATWAKRWSVPVRDTLTEPEFYGNYLYFADTSHGWMSGVDGTFRRTANGGISWERVPGGDTIPVRDMSFGSSSGVAVSWSGLLLRSEDSDASWRQIAAPVRASLSGVDFVDRDHGCIVGQYGIVSTTSNGGNDWTLRSVPTDGDLADVAYADSLNVWAVAAGGTTLHSLDGGVTWATPNYAAYPAPWYYLSLSVALLMFIPALRRPMPTLSPEKTVADLLISDSPVDSPLHDSMNLGSIAEGLSLFIRNEHTMPPLTIAVTGEWGSGKSSLMNLLRGDLVRNEFRPVWFNAWHHQKEEHLLAALLQNIRQQAVAPIWHPTGISFRLRLLLVRWRRFAPMIIILLTLFAVSLGYFMRHPASMTRALEKFSMAASHVESLFSKTGDTVSTNTGSSKDSLGFPSFEKTSFFALLVSSLGGLFLLTTKGLVAFGMTPAVLLNSARKNASVRDLQAQTSFRHKFATEFREVTAALHPRSMVILIDDLDRCRPQNLLDLLEAVNFLVTSGDCYVIMGMDMSRIEQFIRVHYAETNEADFARKYLEKLINIEVPIPRPDPDQALSMIMPPGNVSDDQYIATLNSDKGAGVRRPFSVVFGIAALVVGAFAVTYLITPEQVSNPVPVPIVETGSSGGADEGSVPEKPVSSDESAGKAARTTVTSVQEIDPVRNAGITSGADPSLRIDLLAIPLVVLLFLGAVRLSKKPDVVVRDSEDFTKAISIWSSIIVDAHRTPRSLKRFMNRVRYYAMQQRPMRERERRWWRIQLERLRWLREKQPLPPPSRVISEEKIVALCTLACLQSIDRWNDGLFQGNLTGRADQEGNILPLPPGSVFLDHTIQEHIARFGNWPPSEDDIKAFQRLMGGVRISV